MSKGNERSGLLFKIVAFFTTISMMSFCFWVGNMLFDRVFAVIGFPTRRWVHIITGLFGFGVFILITNFIRVLFQLYHSNHDGNHFWNQIVNSSKFLEDTMGAMDRIARGDFNVFVEVPKENPFSEVANSVNKMAQQLSSMENLRQDFISNVSHEIQSPLTSISGFATLLRDESLSVEQKNHYLDIIVAESKRLSKLSDNLLKLSALESDATEFVFASFSLDKQIENVVLMLEPQWQNKNLNLELSLEKLQFIGDEDLLTQVWINLLNNAIKFTPEGGNISITLSSNEGVICCVISDDGIGVSDEDKIHIFERFYKVDKARDRSLGGNGLGLPIVKNIVEKHQGKITIDSEVNKGTTFTIEMPNG